MDGAFHILQNVNRNDPTAKRLVMKITKNIGLAIIARMHKMKEARMKGDNNIPKMILYFQLGRVQYQKVSNVFSGCHGWRFEFTLGTEDPIPYDENDWFSND
jgi:hypothetical protein